MVAQTRIERRRVSAGGPMTPDRRRFLKILSAGAFASALPGSIKRALAIPAHHRTGTLAEYLLSGPRRVAARGVLRSLRPRSPAMWQVPREAVSRAGDCRRVR